MSFVFANDIAIVLVVVVAENRDSEDRRKSRLAERMTKITPGVEI